MRSLHSLTTRTIDLNLVLSLILRAAILNKEVRLMEREAFFIGDPLEVSPGRKEYRKRGKKERERTCHNQLLIRLQYNVAPIT